MCNQLDPPSLKEKNNTGMPLCTHWIYAPYLQNMGEKKKRWQFKYLSTWNLFNRSVSDSKGVVTPKKFEFIMDRIGDKILMLDHLKFDYYFLI